MSGILDGQPVDAANSNPAWLAANGDDVALGKIDFNDQDADAATTSGPSWLNVQGRINSIASFLGWATNAAYNALPAWATANRGTSSNTVKAKIEAIDTAFDPSLANAAAHRHNGLAGQGPKVSAADLVDLNYLRVGLQLFQASGVAAATSIDVSSYLTGKVAGGTPTQAGVITAPNDNRVELRISGLGDQVENPLTGDKVYGRLTFSTGVWTLSFYTLVVGVQTAYNLPTTTLNCYFQEVFNLEDFPTIPQDPLALLSSNTTNDVVEARPSQKGLTRFAAGQIALAASAQQVVVVFSEVFPDTNYAVAPNFRCSDANPIFLQAMMDSTTKTTAGFTMNFNAATDSANYVFEYTATRFQ